MVLSPDCNLISTLLMFSLLEITNNWSINHILQITFPAHSFTVNLQSGQQLSYIIRPFSSEYFNGTIKMYSSAVPISGMEIQSSIFNLATIDNQYSKFIINQSGKYSFRVDVSTDSEECIQIILTLSSNKQRFQSSYYFAYHKLDLSGFAACYPNFNQPFKAKYTVNPVQQGSMQYQYKIYFNNQLSKQRGAVGPNTETQITINSKSSSTLYLVFKSNQKYTQITEYQYNIQFYNGSLDWIVIVSIVIAGICFICWSTIIVLRCCRKYNNNDNNGDTGSPDCASGNYFDAKNGAQHIESAEGLRKIAQRVQMKNKQCTICLEGELDAILLCNHAFHQKCIRQWFNKNNQCPLCRTKGSKSNIIRLEI